MFRTGARLRKHIWRMAGAALQTTPAYTQDIFILIFCQDARKCCFFLTKDENKYLTSTHICGRILPHHQAITDPRYSVQGCSDPLRLSAFQVTVLRKSWSFESMHDRVSLKPVPVQCCFDKDLLHASDGTYAGGPFLEDPGGKA